MIRRLLPLSGIVFVVGTLLAIAGIGGNTPDIKSSPEKITSFYGAHHSKETFAVYVLFWAIPFLVFFAVDLALDLWTGQSARENVWQLILIGGSVLGAAGFVLAAVTHLSLADGGDHHLSSAAMVALNALDADNYLAFVAGLGVMLVGAAGAIIPRTGGVRWFGWTALVLGIGMFTPVGFFALLLTALWIIVVSVLRFTKPMLFQTPATQPV